MVTCAIDRIKFTTGKISLHDLWIWFVVDVINASDFDQIPKNEEKNFVCRKTKPNQIASTYFSTSNFGGA